MEHLDDMERSFLDNLLPGSEKLPDICRSSQEFSDWYYIGILSVS